jgi:hypothetical protein
MAISDYIKDKNELFNYQYNGNDYYVCGTFIALNTDGASVLMKGNAFKHIEIVDNIYHPFHTAEIIVNNDLNFFDKEYTYLGNGRDMLILTILPNSKYDAVAPLTNDDFVLKFEFIITECIDINYENKICKRLKLVEAKEYKLSETFFNITGIQRSIGGFSYLNTNEGNSKPTSSWIKAILKDVFPEMGEELFIRDLQGNEFFEGEGCINISMVPHGPIPNISVLQYVMQFHTHNGSPCILKFDRVRKKFFVLSYKTLFSNNEVFCKDEMHFGRQATEEEGSSSIAAPNIKYKHHTSVWGPSVLFGNEGNASNILEFYIEPPDASLILKFFTKESINTYSRSHGAFMYNAQTLAPDIIIEKYNDYFVKPFEKIFSNYYDLDKNFHMPQTNAHMTNNWKAVTNSLPPEMSVEQFEIKKLLNLLNLNYTYIYKSKGSTSRKTVTFMDVLKFDNPFNKKNSNDELYDFNHLGRHLITSVKHIFIENSYFNKIETIKPYKLKSKNSMDGFKNTKIEDFLTNQDNENDTFDGKLELLPQPKILLEDREIDFTTGSDVTQGVIPNTGNSNSINEIRAPLVLKTPRRLTEEELINSLK